MRSRNSGMRSSTDQDLPILRRARPPLSIVYRGRQACLSQLLMPEISYPTSILLRLLPAVFAAIGSLDNVPRSSILLQFLRDQRQLGWHLLRYDLHAGGVLPPFHRKLGDGDEHLRAPEHAFASCRPPHWTRMPGGRGVEADYSGGETGGQRPPPRCFHLCRQARSQSMALYTRKAGRC